MEVRCPHCHTPISLSSESPFAAITCPSCGSSFSLLGGEETVSFAGSPSRTIGHFTLLEQMGAGNFGSVWRARDTELDRIVALKIPHKEQLNPAESEQFLREARAAAQLRHTNIVTVYEVGREGDTVFIVSEYVEGVALAEWLTANRPSVREAAELCIKIADALHHAHEAGVIHRDLKPGNIMLDRAGEPHVMDFGLARREAGEVTMTVEGKILGTPAYMSPEQARGEGHYADRRSDVYSLGGILFELLTGEKPFRGTTRMLLHQVLNDEAPSPRKLNGSVPKDLETMCLKCLQKEPTKRYASARDLADDMRRFLTGEPIHARPTTRTERAWRWCKRNPLVASLTTTVGVLLVLGTLISSYFAVIASEQADVAADKTMDALREQQRASEEAERNRRLLYISDLNVAQRAWEDGNVKRVQELLKRYDGKDGKTDLRKCEWYYLWRLLNRSQQHRRLAVDEMPISLSITGDETKGVLATGHARGTIALRRLQDLSASAPEVIRREGKWFATFVCFSPDGRVLAYPNRDNSRVVLRNVESGDQRELAGYSGFINGVAFAPDGGLVAAAGPTGRVAIWDLPFPEPSCTFSVGTVGSDDSTTHLLAFSPDGRLLAIGTTDGVIEIWDVKERSLLSPFKVTAAAASLSVSKGPRVWAVAFSPNGKVLAAGLGDGTVRLWDVVTRAETILIGHQRTVYCVTFSPSGQWLASSSHDCTIRLWDTTNGTRPQTINGHSDGIMEVAFLGDGQTLASAGLDYWIGFWPVAKQVEAREFGDTARRGQLVFIDNRTLATIREGVVRFWDLTTGKEGSPLADGRRQVQCIAISREGLLAVKSVDSMELWDVKANKKGKTLPSPRDFSLPEAGTPLVFSRDGRFLALGGLDRKVSVWGVDDGRLIREFSVPSAIHSLALSPDGRVIATAADEKSVRLWRAEDGSGIGELTGPIDTLRCVTFSPDGDLIAAGGFDNVVRIWKWRDASTPYYSLTDAASSVFAILFSDDGRTLFAGDGYGIRAWDMDEMQQRFRFASSRYIYHLAISRDGMTLAGSEDRGAFEVWRFATQSEVDATPWSD